MNARRYNLSSEHHEQSELMKWAELNRQKFPMLKALFAIANGGHRHITVAMQMKAEGVKPGVPDLMLPYPSNGYNGLFVEMKRRVGGRLSEEQKQWREMLQGYGYCVRVCKGWEEAKDAITDYLTTNSQ